MHGAARTGSRSAFRAGAAATALLFAYTLYCSWLGIDFGIHWDENFNIITPAVWAIEHRTILPNWYYFPSVLHDTALLAAVPDAIALKAAGTQDVRPALIARVETYEFMLRLRRIVSFLAALTPLWLFAGVWTWRRNAVAAFLAAAIAAGSWELQYHSRWATADPLVAQFGALTLALALAGKPRWAAVAAGLACGTKYPGGALLVTVLAACAFTERPLRRMLQAVALFAATFIITTPGAIVQPAMLVEHLGDQMRIYATGWGAYSVDAPLGHLRLLMPYIGLVQLSHFVPLALFLSLVALAGAAVLIRRDRRAAWIVLAFPLFFIGYFGTRHVMIVRNVLVLVPFIAVAAAVGLAWLFEQLTTRTLRTVALAAGAALLLVNLGWLLFAARSIAYSTSRDFDAQAVAFLERNADRKIAISPAVQQELIRFDGKRRERIAPTAPGVELVMFFSRELSWNEHEANRRDYSEMWFGPYDVNFNYYPTWSGRDRIVVARPDHLKPFRR
jgi:hypothetical protein